MPTKHLRSLCAVLWLPLAACLSGQISAGSDAGSQPDAGPDAGLTKPSDAGIDAGRDAGLDAGSDAGSQMTSDGGDAGTDAGTDAGAQDGGCAAESVISCTCSDGGMGTSRCLASGSAWGNCSCATYGAEFYVSPTGSDSAAGTLAAPFLTLERAQTAVRALIAQGPLPPGGVVVWLRGGLYPRSASFALTSDDSGDANAPVVYRGYPGETARLIGGTDIGPSAFQTVTSASPIWSRLDPTAQGQVVSVDLTTLGITDYGTLNKRGFGIFGVPAALELFIDGQRAPLGRWPEQGQTDPFAIPDPSGTQITVYGDLFPDVTGLYLKDSVQDGASSFTRQTLVDGGLDYHLYRSQGSSGTNSYTAWFLTTNATGYPSAANPFFYNYQSALGPMAAAQGASGVVSFVDPTAVINGYENLASVASASSFTFATNRAARWTQAPDPWVHGYFIYPWADEHLAITQVDPTTGALTLEAAPVYGLTPGLQGGGASVAYVYNLLEEITQPGEWYLDRTTGILYLWPPANLASHDFVVSTLSTPLVTVTGASNLSFQEITFEATRTNLLTVAGSSTNVQVVGCVLRDSGDAAASIADGTGNVFDGDLLYNIGEDGIQLNGGDRPSLTPGNNVVQNCDIHDFSQWVSCYTPAVHLGGDGNIVQHNLIHDAPHAAILFYSSSQQLVQYNEIYGVLNFSSDCGAIYAWSDWGSYGNLIQYNFIHDLSSNLAGYGVHAIYLDGCLSGPTVFGNVIDNVANGAILHNGGHDVSINNNIVVNSAAALLTYSVCTSPGAVSCDGGSSDFLQQLQALNYQEDPWASTYPACAAIPDDCATITAPGSIWLTPYGSTFTDNVSFNNAAFYSDDSAATIASYAAFDNNLSTQDPLFVDADGGNYNLQPGSPALALPGYVPIPFDSIGIQP